MYSRRLWLSGIFTVALLRSLAWVTTHSIAPVRQLSVTPASARREPRAASRVPSGSVGEVAGPGEVHRHSGGLRGLDDLGVAHRATRCDDRADARVELHDPARFRDGGQVARMIGLAPQVLQSGPTRREGRLLKSGNARLRTVLVEAAWRWVAGDEAAKATIEASRPRAPSA